MAKRRSKLATQRAQRRAARESAMRKPGTKSAYQKKLRAKFGRGTPDPNWQWWLARGDESPALIVGYSPELVRPPVEEVA